MTKHREELDISQERIREILDMSQEITVFQLGRLIAIEKSPEGMEYQGIVRHWMPEEILEDTLGDTLAMADRQLLQGMMQLAELQLMELIWLEQPEGKPERWLITEAGREVLTVLMRSLVFFANPEEFSET